MNEISGQVINYAKETVAPGCTVSKQILNTDNVGIYVFSLAPNTSISAESYRYHKIIYVIDGNMEIFSSPLSNSSATPSSVVLEKGEHFVTILDIPYGMKTSTGCVYLELGLGKDEKMNDVIKAGDAFKLSELLPYQDDRIVNMDVVSNDHMKYVLMSFDEGTGLSEHAAPGEALVFALEGEAVIGYEGTDYVLKAGETFKFDKMGKHSVTAKTKFKMALLLVLE